jgi:hypothetical protein
MLRLFRRTGRAAAGGCLLLGLTACSAAYINPDAPSQHLRHLDVTANGTAHAQYTYTKAFAKLNGECAEQNGALATVVSGTLTQLRQAKAPGASALSVMQRMAAVIPAGSKKVDCTQVAAKLTGTAH